ncbi:MAG: hypothetical protein WBN23_01705 [Woeseia sp.]
MKRKISSYVLAAASFLILAAQVHATIMLQMNLEEMTTRAGKIFHGTVVDVKAGTIEAGGAALPTVTYRFQVKDFYKGSPSEVKGDKAIVVVRMVGSLKSGATGADGLTNFSGFRDAPRLNPGDDYLLFTTQESSIGLSVPVGLGQGTFKVFNVDGELKAVNEFNNAGLGINGAGPVAYVELSARINALLGQ